MTGHSEFKRELDRVLARELQPVLERHDFQGQIRVNVGDGGTVNNYQISATHRPSEGQVQLRETGGP